MDKSKYITVQRFLKEQIQKGKIKQGEYLPSENELCKTFSITRTTARKALDELLKEGFIEKLHGKGSRVIERRKSLGLLDVRGFSEAVGENVKTIFLEYPRLSEWSKTIQFELGEEDEWDNCLFFSRLRCVSELPVMWEQNWFSGTVLPQFVNYEFVDGSFFKTLSQKYFIEIKGSSQELRAELANRKIASLLKIKENSPVLHISVKFLTSNNALTIYSELYCNTNKFPVGNSYYL